MAVTWTNKRLPRGGSLNANDLYEVIVAGTGGRSDMAGTRLSVRGSDVAVFLTNQRMTRVQDDETGVCQYEVRVCQQASVRGQSAQACVSPRKLLAVRSTNGSVTRGIPE